jgi:hypothetical protein
VKPRRYTRCLLYDACNGLLLEKSKEGGTTKASKRDDSFVVVDESSLAGGNAIRISQRGQDKKGTTWKAKHCQSLVVLPRNPLMVRRSNGRIPQLCSIHSQKNVYFDIFQQE